MPRDVFAPADPDAIVRLHESSAEERAAMGAHGRQHVIAHYSRAALAATYRDVMSDAVTDFAAGRR